MSADGTVATHSGKNLVLQAFYGAAVRIFRQFIKHVCENGGVIGFFQKFRHAINQQFSAFNPPLVAERAEPLGMFGE
ncbi:Uncharacterised protein [Brevundimonas vesicularis]|uniref:Uncharacterized protein n=1 Tax=Brevundimonas vesicularis TaxID=41276 RepID=A0A2X1BN75_BREVE|nr:Uncharacterised protein [Brevundimonas vesicularis]